MKGFLEQSFRFALVGLANTAVGLAAIYGVIWIFDAGPVVANALGYALGFCVSYVLNRRWTFGDRRPALKSLPRYLTLAGVAYLLNLAVVLVAAHQLDLGRYLVQLLGIGLYTGAMFIGSRYLVFRNHADAAASASPLSR